MYVPLFGPRSTVADFFNPLKRTLFVLVLLANIALVAVVLRASMIRNFVLALVLNGFGFADVCTSGHKRTLRPGVVDSALAIRIGNSATRRR